MPELSNFNCTLGALICLSFHFLKSSSTSHGFDQRVAQNDSLHAKNMILDLISFGLDFNAERENFCVMRGSQEKIHWPLYKVKYFFAPCADDFPQFEYIFRNF